MKNSELKKQILELLEGKGKLTPQEIAYQANGNPALIQVHGVLGQLKNSGEVKETVSNKVKYYSVGVVVEVNTPTRDMTKYIFEGVKNLSKGRFALCVVQKFVKESNPTYRQLKDVFHDGIVKPYGVVQDLATAHELSPDPKRKRYFLNEPDVIQLSRGKVKKVVVTNQWTTERFNSFLEVVEVLGYQVGSS